MISLFIKGETIPSWVLRAPNFIRQKDAKFNVDVIISHGEDCRVGPVRVQPFEKTSFNEPLFIIHEVHKDGLQWNGAPTNWDYKPFNENLIEVLNMDMTKTDPEIRLQIIKTLNVEKYLEELGKLPEKNFMPNEDQALMVLHKARYFLARQGHLDKKYMQDSRRWLLSNGIKLPNA